MAHKLILKSGCFPDFELELSANQLPVVLGRSRSADITIDDALLSRRHCEIRVNGAGEFEIRDLDSTNLTIVNKHDIESHILRSDDRILLGETEIEVTVVAASTSFNEQTTREIDTLPEDLPPAE